MLLLALVLLALAAPAHAAPVWRWPLRGEVLTPFRLGANPFAPGQHRGVDIAAAAGAPVHSVCAGRVSFAGRIPRRGRAITVVCGPLVATYLELGAVSVARGARVGRGARLGTVAASHLQLGARRTGERHGYVDPLTLLGASPPPPVGAAPSRRPPRLPPAEPRPALPPPRLAPRPVPAARPSPSAPGAARDVPPTVWLGLALFTAGMPLGALAHRRRVRRSVRLRAVDEGA